MFFLIEGCVASITATKCDGIFVAKNYDIIITFCKLKVAFNPRPRYNLTRVQCNPYQRPLYEKKLASIPSAGNLCKFIFANSRL